MENDFVDTLFESLQASELPVGLRERMLLERAFWLNPEEAVFRDSVALIVAKSEKDRELCNQIFNSLLNHKHIGSVPIPGPVDPLSDTASKKRLKQIIVLSIVFAILAFSAGITVILLSRSNTEKAITETTVPSTTLPKSKAPKEAQPTDPSAPQLTEKQSTELSIFDLLLLQLKIFLASVNYYLTKLLSLFSLGGIVALHLAWLEVRDWLSRNYFDLGTGFSILLLGIAAWKLFDYLKKRRFLPQSFYQLWISPKKYTPFVRNDITLAFAQHLNQIKLTAGPSDWLDEPATVEATLQQGGIPAFLWEPIQKPISVLLIQEKSSRSQAWDLALQQWIKELQNFGVDTEIYSVIPQHPEHFISLHNQMLSFEELYAQYSSHYLLLITTDDALWNDQRQLHAWVQRLDKWKYRTWFRLGGTSLLHKGLAQLAEYIPVVPFNNLGLSHFTFRNTHLLQHIHHFQFHRSELSKAHLPDVLALEDYHLLCATAVMQFVDFPWLLCVQQRLCPQGDVGVFTVIPQLPEVQEVLTGLYEIPSTLQETFIEELEWSNPLLLKQVRVLRLHLLHADNRVPKDSYANLKRQFLMWTLAKEISPKTPVETLVQHGIVSLESGVTSKKYLRQVFKTFRGTQWEAAVAEIFDLPRFFIWNRWVKLFVTGGMVVLLFFVLFEKYKLLGDFYHLLGNPDEAKRWYTVAIERNLPKEQVEPEILSETSDQTSYRITRDWMNSQLANFSQLLNDARVVPITKNNETFFRFKHIKKNGVYEILGLKRKDIILSINDYKIDSIEKALTVYKQLQSAPKIDVLLQRGGKEVKMEYYVVGGELDNLVEPKPKPKEEDESIEAWTIDEEETFNIKRELLEGIKDWEGFVQDARVVPKQIEDKMYWLLKHVRNDSFFEKMHLRKNDILIQINEKDVSETIVALEQIQLVQSLSEFTFTIRREGQILRFKYIVE